MSELTEIKETLCTCVKNEKNQITRLRPECPIHGNIVLAESFKHLIKAVEKINNINKKNNPALTSIAFTLKMIFITQLIMAFGFILIK